MENVTILGSTGSIGRSTLEVVDLLSQRFKVVGLAAGRNLALLYKQAEKFKPEIVALEREEDAVKFKQNCKEPYPQVTFGTKGAEEAARYYKNDIVVSAITGIKGLRPTMAAVEAGKRVALANKESMVTAGFLLREAADKNGAEIIPVDSEHSAVFQCLAKEQSQDVKKVILTASGGPFFRLSRQEMKSKSLDDALKHPCWNMGKKVTIDSATMMNKGLELLEAQSLFCLKPQQLDVVVHPQSIIHSLVEMKDGSVLAQLSITDMKIPIQYALTYPERCESPVPALDLKAVKSLEFMEADHEKFPLLRLAFLALHKDRCFSVALNASNEVAVEAFLNKEIKFIDIFEIVDETINSSVRTNIETLEDIFSIDRETRKRARNLIRQRI